MQVREAVSGEGTVLAALTPVVHDLHVARRPEIFRDDPDLDELARTFDAWIADDAYLTLIAQTAEEPVGYLIGNYMMSGGHTLTRPMSLLMIEQIAVAADRGLFWAVPVRPRVGQVSWFAAERASADFHLRPATLCLLDAEWTRALLF